MAYACVSALVQCVYYGRLESQKVWPIFTMQVVWCRLPVGGWTQTVLSAPLYLISCLFFYHYATFKSYLTIKESPICWAVSTVSGCHTVLWRKTAGNNTHNVAKLAFSFYESASHVAGVDRCTCFIRKTPRIVLPLQCFAPSPTSPGMFVQWKT